MKNKTAVTTETIISPKSITEQVVYTPRLKCLDLGFLSMKLMNGLPRFAVTPLDAYDYEKAAWAVMRESGRVETTKNYSAGNEENGGLDMSVLPSGAFYILQKAGEVFRENLDWNRPEILAATLQRYIDQDKLEFYRRLSERINVRDAATYTYNAAFPSSRMPDAIREVVDAFTATKKYGPVFIAWEASWSEVLRLTFAGGMRPQSEPLDPIAFARHLSTGKYHILGTWDLTKLESYIAAEFTE